MKDMDFKILVMPVSFLLELFLPLLRYFIMVSSSM